jgi:hypothetical protein
VGAPGELLEKQRVVGVGFDCGPNKELVKKEIEKVGSAGSGLRV